MKLLRSGLVLLPLLLGAAYPVPPRAERGRADADCRQNESGPAFRVTVDGLKDRSGRLVLELYPANDADFLAPDKKLIAEGKVFRRVPMATPASGTVVMCVRAPKPGRYALSLLHDRDNNGKFGWMRDGIGFASNPKLGLKQPASAKASASVGDGLASIHVVMNYRSGLGMAPVKTRSGS